MQHIFIMIMMSGSSSCNAIVSAITSRSHHKPAEEKPSPAKILQDASLTTSEIEHFKSQLKATVT